MPPRLALYLRFLTMHLKGQMQYKTSFFLSVAAQFLVSLTGWLGVYFMFSRFRSVEGFTLGQAMLCFGVMEFAFSSAQLFGRGFDAFPAMLSNGQFDRILVRPLNAVFQVLAMQMDFKRLGRLAQAAVVLALALPMSGVDWTGGRLLVLFLMVLGAAAVFFGLFLAYAALSFFTVEGLEFMNVLTDGGCQFGYYPYSIYGRRILYFLTFAVPLALAQYWPLLYLLDRVPPGAAAAWLGAAPLAGVAFLLPCGLLFRWGMSRHRSTGS